MAHRELPQLDLLTSFESAARQLSFTRAAAELFLTQSAVSRQIQALEEQLGVPLFERRHRALELTDAGRQLHHTTLEVLRLLRDTTARIGAVHVQRPLTVTTMVTFASVWLVPRLPAFRAAHPGVDVYISARNEMVDLERERIDVAIRYLPPERAPAGARRLFGESVLPLCAPALLDDPARPLRRPADLAQQVLLHMDDASTLQPWLDWRQWLASLGLADVPHTGGALHFSHYDQMVGAAVAGQGVIMGRLPLLAEHVRCGRLVAPFAAAAGTANVSASRGYFVLVSAAAAAKPEVQRFVDWLHAQARADEDGFAAPEPQKRNSRLAK